MSAIVKLTPELKNWILHNLDRGCAPEQLIRGMIEQRFDPGIARGLVEAFQHSRGSGIPIEGDTLTLNTATPAYREEPSRMPVGNYIQTSDRRISVITRLTRPVMTILDGVLSPAECEQLIALAAPRLVPSTVVDPRSGEDRVAAHRDSMGMFFRLLETPFIAALDRRIATLMGAPPEHGEGLQAVRYGPGTKAAPHFDFLMPSNAANERSIARSGQRISTLVVYLNEVEHGGETVFPEIGLSVAPYPGRAVYFEYCNTLGQLDFRSLHAGAPVGTGVKWVLTKWIRQRRFVSAAEEAASAMDISS
jgi:prolyl 4-hydroxylase